MNKKVLIVVLAIIGIVVIGGAIAMMSTEHHTVNDSCGECKYIATQVDSYTHDIGYGPVVEHPAEGKMFIRVTGTLTNNQDYWTISNKSYNFQLSAEGLHYNCKYNNYDMVYIAKGATANIDLCFEVPSTATDIELKWAGIGNITMIKQLITQ